MMKTFLTTDNLLLRLIRLFVGLLAYGLAIALMIRGNIGASPWDVFGQGLAHTTGLSFGLCTVMISAGVLLLWIPLKQLPGFGTLANAVLIGFFADFGLALIPAQQNLLWEVLMFLAGLLLLAFATALYVGARLGPGPRDGLMTGLVRRTGRPVWMVRTSIEVLVVVVGFFLGGLVGIGTLAFALGIGPLTQLAFRLLWVNLGPRESAKSAASAPAAEVAAESA